MQSTEHLQLIFAFVIIGVSTFLIRASFLFKFPTTINQNRILRKGLESVPSSLLVALVIPFTFFSMQQFSPFRLEVFAILLTIPIIWIIKKPGLSLPIAIILIFILNLF